MTEPFTITPENRDRHIAETLEFCDNVTLKFVRQANLIRWRADLLSIARLKLVQIFNTLAENGQTVQNQTHLFAKLRISLRRRLIDASEEFYLIRTPRRRGRDRQGLPCTWLIGGTDIGKVQRSELCRSGGPGRFASNRWADNALPVPEKTTREDLFGRCRDGVDRAILVQALTGRTRKEIANDLQIAQRDVRERCGRLLKAGPN